MLTGPATRADLVADADVVLASIAEETPGVAQASGLVETAGDSAIAEFEHHQVVGDVGQAGEGHGSRPGGVEVEPSRRASTWKTRSGPEKTVMGRHMRVRDGYQVVDEQHQHTEGDQISAVTGALGCSTSR